MTGSQTVSLMNFKKQIHAQFKLSKTPNTKDSHRTHVLRLIVPQMDIFLILGLLRSEKKQTDAIKRKKSILNKKYPWIL